MCGRFALYRSREALQALLVPEASGALLAYPVGRRVNRAVEDDAALIEPLTHGETGQP